MSDSLSRAAELEVAISETLEGILSLKREIVSAAVRVERAIEEQGGHTAFGARAFLLLLHPTD